MGSLENSESETQSLHSGFFARYVLSSDHKAVGLQFLALALFSVILGMSLSFVMRMHLGNWHRPFTDWLAQTPERYGALLVFHGSLMVFFVLTAAPQFGFGHYFLPLQIGARNMAFPSWSVASLWMNVGALAGMTVSFTWAPDSGIVLWLGSATLFCGAALLAALNFCVTAIDCRTEGMTFTRLPLTAWSWLITAILSLLIFSILPAACALLLSDRFWGTHFFSSAVPVELVRHAVPGLWQRWFWFFAQAQVYVAMLPCFGIVSHLMSLFSRKPVWKERMAALALCGVGVFGFCVWGFHMFSSGLNPNSPLVFSLLASSLGFPAAFLVASWLGTLWNAKPQLTTSMLFALGFVSLFLSGGLTGIFLSRSDLAAIAVTNDFVTGHFHLVMGVAATFAILGGFFFWFPKMFGRKLNEPLGKIHFWLTFAGVYCVFMPMHWLGLLDRGKGIQLQGPVAYSGSFGIREFISVATVITIGAQLFFVVNIVWTLLRGERVKTKNPWRATTLEWFVASPPVKENFASPPIVYRGAYEIGRPFAGEDFIPQHLAPEQVAKYR